MTEHRVFYVIQNTHKLKTKDKRLECGAQHGLVEISLMGKD